MNEYLVSCEHSWLYGKIKALYGGDGECRKIVFQSSETRRSSVRI